MKDLCVIIGAGASAFHSRDKKACPPLGKDLAEAIRYDENLNVLFKEVEGSVGKCKDSFENWMGRFEKTDTASYNKVLMCLSGFFSKYGKIPEDSLYLKLIEEFGAKRIPRTVFVSLNYESLFEIALREKGYGIYWGTEVEKDEFNTEKDYLCETSVYKPHGSSNFIQSKITEIDGKRSGQNEPTIKVGGSSKIHIVGFHIIGGGQSEPAIKAEGSSELHLSNVLVEGGIESAYTSSIESPVSVVDPQKIYLSFSSGFNRKKSVLCAYNKGKIASFSPSFIGEIRAKLKNEISNVKKALIIGISCNKGDKFLNSVLKSITKSSSQVGYVGGESDHKKYMKFLKKDKNFFPYLGKLNHFDMEQIINFIHSM